MRTIDATGSPYDIGRTIGAGAADLVVQAVELICRIDLPPATLEERLAGVERRLAAVFPETLEEAEGVAAGAGISRRDALVLSVASDLHGRLPGWCSLGAVAAEQGGKLVAKNLDTHEELQGVLLFERLAPSGKLSYAHLTVAGAMWTDGGLNEAGLALVNASLDPRQSSPTGLPDGIVARELLARCETVADAIAFCDAHDLLTLGENVLVADATGRSALIEKLPGMQEVREEGTIVACNHPLVDRLGLGMRVDDPIRGNSERRHAQLGTALVSRARWSPAELGSALAADGVCQHGADGLWTIASMVLSPTERRVWLADGPPCETPLIELAAGSGDAEASGETEVVTDGGRFENGN